MLARSIVAITFLAIAVPSVGFAQVTNGDFEAGGTGWTPQVPATWLIAPAGITFQAVGGNPNGYAHIQSPFGTSGGTGCIEQIFVCGTDEQAHCVISVDYMLRSIDAAALTGRVKIMVDGNVEYTSPPTNDQPWTSVTVVVPCGTHRLQLCLEVDAGNNGWEAGFDNVSSVCDIPVGATEPTWGSVKSLFD
jgi:hypothetical protein